MKVTIVSVNELEYVVIDDFYTEAELTLIKNELPSILPNATRGSTGSATNIANGELMKTNRSIFLDELYSSNRDASSILRVNRKIFNNEAVDNLCKHNNHYNHIRVCSMDNTLVNFYGVGDVYAKHKDNSIFTILSMFKLGEFTGGELLFPDYDVEVKFKDNRVVIFAGCTYHATNPIIGATEPLRVTMAQFLNYGE